MMHVPSLSPLARTPSPQPPPSGGRMVSTTGRALPLIGAAIAADAAGGIARVTVEQRFQNPHAEPLAVTYSLPLPADGAVSGFAFSVGGRRTVGEIDGRRAARERYEQALVEGRSAALLEQEQVEPVHAGDRQHPARRGGHRRGLDRPAPPLARRGGVGVALPHGGGAPLPGRAGPRARRGPRGAGRGRRPPRGALHDRVLHPRRPRPRARGPSRPRTRSTPPTRAAPCASRCARPRAPASTATWWCAGRSRRPGSGSRWTPAARTPAARPPRTPTACSPSCRPPSTRGVGRGAARSHRAPRHERLDVGRAAGAGRARDLGARRDAARPGPARADRVRRLPAALEAGARGRDRGGAARGHRLAARAPRLGRHRDAHRASWRRSPACAGTRSGRWC